MKKVDVPDFFFTENKVELPGAGLVQSNKAPFYLAMIFKFNNDANAYNFESTHKPIIKIGIYNIYLLMYTSLIPTMPENEAQTIKALLKEMADFYVKEKIAPNESYHKRFLTGRK
jgi:hypothetical protein